MLKVLLLASVATAAGTAYAFAIEPLAAMQRETAVEAVRHFADLNDVGFIDDQAPKILDTMHAKGMSYADARDKLLVVIMDGDKQRRLANVSAIYLTSRP